VILTRGDSVIEPLWLGQKKLAIKLEKLVMCVDLVFFSRLIFLLKSETAWYTTAVPLSSSMSVTVAEEGN